MSKTSLTRADFRTKNQKDMTADGTFKIFAIIFSVVENNVICIAFSGSTSPNPFDLGGLGTTLMPTTNGSNNSNNGKRTEIRCYSKRSFLQNFENDFCFFSECCYGYETQEGSPVDPGRTLEPCQLRRTCFFNGKTTR